MPKEYGGSPDAEIRNEEHKLDKEELRHPVDREPKSRREILDMLRHDLAAFNAWRGKYPWEEVNLQRENLEGLDLRRALLFMARLDGSNLTGANLKDANLIRATLTRSMLAHVDFQGADLEGVSFSASDLKHANLRGTNVDLAIFREANLEGADLREIRYKRVVTFEGANLKNAQLPEKWSRTPR